MAEVAKGERTFRLGSAAVIVTLVCVVFLGGAWLYRQQGRDLRQQAEDELSSIAQLKASEIATWRTDRLLDGQRMSSSPSIGLFVRRWLEDPTPQHAEQLEALLESLRYEDRYRGVSLVDTVGRVLMTVGEGAKPQLHTEARQGLANVLRTRSAVLTDLHVFDGEHAPQQDIIAPVYDDAGVHVAAAIVLHADARDFLYPLVEAWPIPSETAETLLVTRANGDALLLSPAKHAANAELNLRLPMERTEVSVVRAARGEQGLVEAVDYAGTPVMAYLTPIGDSGWHMVAEMDLDEVFSPWRTRATYIAALVLAMALVVVGMYVLMVQQARTAQLSRLLDVERARRAAEARFRVTLASVGDAVISTDAACLVEFMNPVAEELTGWRIDEARGQELETVFEIRNEQTGEPAENPAAKVVREGVTVGLANHTLLVSRDGAERAIADSAAPIRDGAGETTGVVLVFRDQTEERAAANALRASEERFRSLVEGAPEAIFVQTEGRLAYVNESMCRLLGAEDPDELLGTPVLDHVHPDWRDLGQARIEALNDGKLRQTARETVFMGVDGAAVPVETSGMPITYEGLDGALVFARDITQRKQRQALLDIRTRLLEVSATASLVELLTMTLDEVGEFLGSPIGFYHFVDADQRSLTLQAWSTATTEHFCAVEGYGHHYDVDAAGVWVDCVRERRAVVHNDYASLPNRRGLPDGHAPVVRELVVPVFRDDSIVAILGVGNKDQDYTDYDVEAAAYLADATWDIVERKRIDQALRESDKRFRTLIEQTDQGVSVGRPDGTMLVYNDAMERISGYTRHEVEEGGWFDLVFPTRERKDDALRLSQEALEGGARYVEVPIVRKEGEERWLSVSTNPVQIGDVDYNLSIFTDVTERKAAEEELERHRNHLTELVSERTRELELANAALAEATYAKSRFLANMSHELRTPLNSIIGFSGILAQGLAGRLSHEQATQVRMIHTSSKHLLALINDVLDLARVEAGGLELHPESFDPVQVLAEVAETVRPMATSKGLELIVDAPDEPAEMYSDALKLRQILINLAGNAVKFTDSGEVCIALRVAGDTEAVFTVADTGPGIPSAELESIFEAFNQVDYPSRMKPQGTGLGLAISREYARLLDGRISVRSTVGEGSEFTFVVPLRMDGPRVGTQA